MRKGALKKVSVGQHLEEGRVVDRIRRGKWHFRLRGWHRQVRKTSSCQTGMASSADLKCLVDVRFGTIYNEEH